MEETPKKTWRRFFQFRLSTWLVLVGILASAMATRPYRVWMKLDIRNGLNFVV